MDHIGIDDFQSKTCRRRGTPALLGPFLVRLPRVCIACVGGPRGRTAKRPGLVDSVKVQIYLTLAGS